MSAYLISRINVTDPEKYMTYASQTVALAERYGGRFLVKGGEQVQIEGSSPDRHVVIEFPDRETAMKWYESDEYQKILPVALSSSERDSVIVDGMEE